MPFEPRIVHGAVPAPMRLAALGLLALPAFATGLTGQQRVVDGDWIGEHPVPATRIWSQQTLEKQVIWLRRTFRVEKPVTAARIVVTCDNGADVRIDGHLAVRGAANWQDVVVHDVTARFAPGDVTLAVRATNDGGPAALALWCQWSDADGDHAVVTDGDWRVSDAEITGWEQPGFDQRDWAEPRVMNEIPLGSCASGGPPEHVLRRGPVDDAMEEVLAAIAAARTSQDPEQALKALDQVERALVQARQHLWRALERRQRGDTQAK
ncbi:MAG: hypothetical protein AB7O97_14595 [Planctomycetota bacterium]